MILRFGVPSPSHDRLLDGSPEPLIGIIPCGSSVPLTGLAYPAVGGAPSGAVGFTVDARGRRTAMSDVTGTTSWTYDLAGQTIRVVDPTGTLDYVYDAAGQLTSLTRPGNKTETRAFDANGRLTALTDWDARTISFGYDQDGNPTSIVRANGVSSALSYDGAGRLAMIEHTAGQTMLQRFVYELDANANRTKVTSSGVPVPGAETYVYDNLDRLTNVSYADGGNVSYDYDANGNRTSVTSGGQTATYSYDDADQLTAIAGTTNLSFTYDGAGNRLSAGADQFQYDWRNRLSQATVDGQTVSYGYTGDDLRVSRTEGSATSTLLWDREAGLPELVEEGGSVHLHLGDGELATILPDHSATYPLLDALGTARGVSDSGGALVASADYDAFGTLRAQTGAQPSHGWTGERQDPTTGLVYLRASREVASGHIPVNACSAGYCLLAPDAVIPIDKNPCS